VIRNLPTSVREARKPLKPFAMPLVSHAGEFTMSVKIDGQDATVYQEKHHQEGDGRTRSEGWICSEVGKVGLGSIATVYLLSNDFEYTPGIYDRSEIRNLPSFHKPPDEA
jgi:hypothetical protein